MTCAYVDTSSAYMPIGQKSLQPLAEALGLDDMAAALGTDHVVNPNGLNSCSSEVTAYIIWDQAQRVDLGRVATYKCRLRRCILHKINIRPNRDCGNCVDLGGLSGYPMAA